MSSPRPEQPAHPAQAARQPDAGRTAGVRRRRGATRPAHPSGWPPVRRSPFGQRVLLFSIALGVSGFFGFSALRQVQPSSPEADRARCGPRAPRWPPRPRRRRRAPALPLRHGRCPTRGAGDGPPDIVKITFQTIPPVKAEVFWGRKRLGIINGARRPPIKPLIVERPRDSGPIDVMVNSEGFLPVNTRAYTFTDTKVNVKLTLLTEKHTLLGFKQALPDAGADGGVDDGGNPLPPPPGPPPPTRRLRPRPPARPSRPARARPPPAPRARAVVHAAPPPGARPTTPRLA